MTELFSHKTLFCDRLNLAVKMWKDQPAIKGERVSSERDDSREPVADKMKVVQERVLNYNFSD